MRQSVPSRINKKPLRKRGKPATQVEGRLWITRGKQNLAGRGRIELLKHIDACGSISQAAKIMGMGYKSAWDAVDAMNNCAGKALVERAVGGRGGGGTALTAEGRKLVAAFQLFESEHQRFLERLSTAADSVEPYVNLLGGLSMRTSARNQFSGTVSAIKTGAVNDEIELTLLGGDRIVATITSASTRSLDLKVGSEAFALIKASWIILAPEAGGMRTSARNTFNGKIARIERGAVNSEVTLTLPGGAALVAIVTNSSVDNLPLQEGQAATALFKASHVIVGVPA
jgi:molybdate transport system regulatory protein